MNKYVKPFASGFKFRTKITLGVTLMLVFCGLGIGLILSQMSSRALLEEGRKRGATLTAGLAYRMSEPILSMNFLQMKNFIDNVHNQYPDVMYVFLMDASDNILSHTFSGGFPTDLLRVNVGDHPAQPVLLMTERGLVYDFKAEVILGERNLGTVRLGLSRHAMDSLIQRQRWTSLFITLGVLALCIMLTLWFARTVTLRLNRLRESAEEMVRGHLDVQTGFELKRNCWEIMDCGKTECPAFGDERRRCWYLAGTLCPNCQDSDYPQKMDSCHNCLVYRHNFGDEIQQLAHAFDVMALTVKNNIEELTLREQTIARQQGLLKTIMNVTPDFITLQDKNLSYKFASKSFYDHFNCTEADVIGKTGFDIFSQRQADQNYHEDMQMLMTGKPLSKEISFKKGGNLKCMHVFKVPVYDSEENIIGLLMTARDITMLKKYQDQLIQSQKMEDLGRLAGGVAHEINTPLGIILGYTQLLLEDMTNPDVIEDLEIIQKQTRVCRKIVADLLGFSRYSQSVGGSVNVNQSLREVIKLVEHVFSLSHIRIICQLDDNIPLITGDKERLKQVWLNLLNNASDAIGQDGCIYVHSKLCAHRERLLVSVTDSGTGIDAANLNKIFDPFFTTKRVGKGTGLGLSVSFGIIKDHHGNIFAFSPPPAEYLPGESPASDAFNTGTVVVVELPLISSEAIGNKIHAEQI